MLPIVYAPFNGIYNVRLDEGSVLLVSHCDLRLVHNTHAEASSWVRAGPSGDCSNSSEQELELQEHHHQQATAKQAMQRRRPEHAQDGSVSHEEDVRHQQAAAPHSTLSQTAASAVTRLAQMLLPSTGITKAQSAAARAPAGVNWDSAAKRTVADAGMDEDANDADSEGEQEKEEYAAPLLRRRTKRSVAQRMAPKMVAAVLPAAADGRSVRRKLAHSQHADLAESHHTDVFVIEPPLAWDHESDDDLFVDLSGCNIRAPTGIKTEVKPDAKAENRLSASPVARNFGIASKPMTNAPSGPVGKKAAAASPLSQKSSFSSSTGRANKTAPGVKDKTVINLD